MSEKVIAVSVGGRFQVVEVRGTHVSGDWKQEYKYWVIQSTKCMDCVHGVLHSGYSKSYIMRKWKEYQDK